MTNKFKMVGLLMCVAAVAMATSCGREDDNMSKIIGNWTVVETSNQSLVVSGVGCVWNINADGGFISRYAGSTTEGTWLVSGDTLKLYSGRSKYGKMYEEMYEGIIHDVTKKRMKLNGYGKRPGFSYSYPDIQLKRVE